MCLTTAMLGPDCGGATGAQVTADWGPISFFQRARSPPPQHPTLLQEPHKVTAQLLYPPQGVHTPSLEFRDLPFLGPTALPQPCTGASAPARPVFAHSSAHTGPLLLPAPLTTFLFS